MTEPNYGIVPRNVWYVPERTIFDKYGWIEDRLKVWTSKHDMIRAWYFFARQYIEDVLRHSWWVYWRFEIGSSTYYRRIAWYEFPWTKPDWTPWEGCIGADSGGFYSRHPFPLGRGENKEENKSCRSISKQETRQS